KVWGVAAVLATWATAVAVTRQMAPRLDRGSESSPEIRRAVAAGELRLTDLAPPVRRVHLDLVMAGAEVGWRPDGTDDDATGLDLTVHAKLSGVQLTVPPGSRVWWRHRGPGRVSLTRGRDLTRVDSAEDADVRIEAVLVFAGLSVTGRP
ncbi:MAG TPA: hypothetical protein VK908_01630, partial [Jiangellales bacterium]|nr:hypothetical protein [Jiangellales bacterium]